MNYKKIHYFPITFFIFGFLFLYMGVYAPSMKALANPWKSAPSIIVLDKETPLPDVAKIIRQDPFAEGLRYLPQNQKVPESKKLIPQNIIPNMLPNTSGLQPQNGPGVPLFDGSVPNAGPNIPGGIIPGGSSPTAEISLVATMISSEKPLALINNNGISDIVGIGDSIGNQRIRRIVLQGIEFENGNRLSVKAPQQRSSVPNPQNVSNPFNNSQNTLQDILNKRNQFLNQSRLQRSRIPINQSLPSTQQNLPPQDPNAGSSINGVPVVPSAEYTFGPTQNPQPGGTAPPINRLYTPPPSPTNITTPTPRSA